jgi:hypothetical protein
MSTFRNQVQWYFSGFNTQEAAEKALAGEVAWFNQTFPADEWSLVTTVRGTPNGWVAEYTGVKS